MVSSKLLWGISNRIVSPLLLGELCEIKTPGSISLPVDRFPASQGQQTKPPAVRAGALPSKLCLFSTETARQWGSSSLSFYFFPSPMTNRGTWQLWKQWESSPWELHLRKIPGFLQQDSKGKSECLFRLLSCPRQKHTFTYIIRPKNKAKELSILEEFFSFVKFPLLNNVLWKWGTEFPKNGGFIWIDGFLCRHRHSGIWAPAAAER